MSGFSPLQSIRLTTSPKLPLIFNDIGLLTTHSHHSLFHENLDDERLIEFFPKTFKQPILSFVKSTGLSHHPLKIGVVLSGGQAAGGHNVIAGVFDAVKALHSKSRVIGFLNGPSGIVDNQYIEITGELLSNYRNQGGFDIIGSGRTKIETKEQFEAAEITVRKNDLDGLIVIGGDDSNTNAAFLAEYFLERNIKTKVVGVPKTIDGDLKNKWIEISFGFDTACKVFSDIIGNVLRDSFSSKKYYFFIKLMGRSASHIALECALSTHPNLTLIGEEIQANKKTLKDITNEICDLIADRAYKGKDYGVILIPEGIIEFIPEFKHLISELNKIFGMAKLESLNSAEEKITYIMDLLSPASKECFKAIPQEIQLQLLLDRDPHGNVQVSKIETERLFVETVKIELKRRKKEGSYVGKFSAQPLFCGYEGRSALPSVFDANYCYTLGHVAALLINSGATGYLACVSNLTKPVEEWQISGIPFLPMITVEQRLGKEKIVIKKALVDLEGKPFTIFKNLRSHWRLEDDYQCPGPIQFFGPQDIVNAITHTLTLEQ